MYNFFFDKGLLVAANQIGEFKSDIIELIVYEYGFILLFLLPVLFIYILRKKINYQKGNLKYSLPIVLLLGITYLFIYSPGNITTGESIIKRGVIGTFITDFKTKEDVELVVENNIDEETDVEEKEIEYNALNINFDEIENASGEIANLNEYVQSSTGTNKNDYTGLFKDKNLILIMGESFNSICINKDLTPNLYKLQTEGFDFTNYYSTSYNSTLGGEFQLLTGMYAYSNPLGIWKAGTNSFPMGIGYKFSEAGYSINAYHDHAYDYQDRNKYLASIGIENYVGCYNGLEKRMTCGRYFDLDSEMAEVTYEDYINNDKFFAYYVTMSGHGPYNFSTTVGPLHRQEIIDAGYNYSEKVMAYMSGMMELDKMVGTLLEQLTAAGKLDDTVIMIVGDHYPYYLDPPEIAELCGYTKEENLEVCENDLIIYNSATEKVTCDKTGNTMDVLATIYNLFGIDYDSRLIPGKDLFSDAPGFAYFGNGSWISDYGVYNTALGTFVPYDEETLPENYFEEANAYARSQMNMTNLIMNNNYYKYILISN